MSRCLLNVGFQAELLLDRVLSEAVIAPTQSTRHSTKGRRSNKSQDSKSLVKKLDLGGGLVGTGVHGLLHG